MQIIFLISVLQIASAGLPGLTGLPGLPDLGLNSLKTLIDLPLDVVKDIVHDVTGGPEYKTDVNATKLIESEGYPFEVHTITTTDGYILNLHRIPKGKKGKSNGKVAFVQHGLLCSSADFLIAGSEKGLAYILADAGYDVWMGNARGNSHSRGHVSLRPDRGHKFWEFSWHEIGTIDIPQMIDYVLKNTGVSSVYYVGHSQGTTSFFVMNSMLPEYNQKIKVGVMLAPIAYMDHMTSPLMKIISFWDRSISILLDIIGVDEFLPQSNFISELADTICSANSITQVLCTNSLFAICGFSEHQMNATLLPLMMSYSPAGASTRQLLHYAQEINSGKFCQYDFGTIANELKYGALSPPDYPLNQVTAPVHLVYSYNDWLAAEVDVKRLCNEIKNCEEMFVVPDEKFNHLDFLFGIDAPTLVYRKVLEIFKSH